MYKVIYHHPCADGFASMLVAKMALGNSAEYIQGQYQNLEPVEAYIDSEIYLVDFSWKRDYLEEVLKVAKSVTIIDHHKTAIDELNSLVHPKLYKFFSLNYSGVGLTWAYFFENMIIPPLFADIEDRDLWRFARPNSKVIFLYLTMIGFDEAKWMELIHDIANYNEAIKIGTVLQRYKDSLIEQIVSKKLTCSLAGYNNIPLLINCPSPLISEALHILAKDAPFAANYSITEKGKGWSLRASDDSEIDVSAIAKSFGGGGHKKAAGFFEEEICPL